MSEHPSFAPIPATLPETVPFVGAMAMERQRGKPFAAWLGANELTLPPSPKVIAAFKEAAAQATSFYPDERNHDLLNAIAAHYGRDSAEIMVGEGIDGLLGLCVRLFLAPGETVVTSHGAYPTFNYHVAGFGGRLVTVPYRDDAEDLNALAVSVREQDAKLVYLSNPDNPMGSWHSHAAIEAFVDSLPPSCVVLLDEAYAEFMDAPEAVTPDDFTRPNLIRLRTFSKAYGLAGLRVGYLMAAPKVASAFHRIRNHFGVNAFAQAGALAALHDRAHLNQTLRLTAQGRATLVQIAHSNGLTPLPSATNFVTMDCGGDGDFARRVLAEVLARDVFIRMPGIAPLDRCIRVTVGTAEELALFADVLPEALKAARG